MSDTQLPVQALLNWLDVPPVERKFVTNVLGCADIDHNLWWKIAATAGNPLFARDATHMIADSLMQALKRPIDADIARCAGILAKPAHHELAYILAVA